MRTRRERGFQKSKNWDNILWSVKPYQQIFTTNKRKIRVKNPRWQSHQGFFTRIFLEFGVNIWDSAEWSSEYCHYSLLFGRHNPLNIQYPSLGMNTVKYASLLLLLWCQKAWNNGKSGFHLLCLSRHMTFIAMPQPGGKNVTIDVVHYNSFIHSSMNGFFRIEWTVQFNLR